jgi:Rod binding domain-containing protein
VAEVSRQFESVLLRQILGAARKTIFRSKFNEDSMASGIYQDMTTSQLADAISRNGSFGLARSLEAQLIRQNGVRPSPGSESNERSGRSEIVQAAGHSDVAAGEDARAPGPSPSAANVRRIDF